MVLLAREAADRQRDSGAFIQPQTPAGCVTSLFRGLENRRVDTVVNRDDLLASKTQKLFRVGGDGFADPHKPLDPSPCHNHRCPPSQLRGY